MTRRKKGPDTMHWFTPEPPVDVENFDLGEMVRFDLDFPADPDALVNDPRLRRIYEVYLSKLDGIKDFAGRDRLKRDMLGLLQAVENFDVIVPKNSDHRQVARHSLAVIVLRAYALGSMSSSDDKATAKMHDTRVEHGKKGGEAKSAKAANTWHRLAIPQLEIWREDYPGIGQVELANSVVDQWKGEDPCPVRYHAMLKLIRKLEGEGTIPRAIQGGRKP